MKGLAAATAALERLGHLMGELSSFIRSFQRELRVEKTASLKQNDNNGPLSAVLDSFLVTTLSEYSLYARKEAFYGDSFS